MSLAPHWTGKKHKNIDENGFLVYNKSVDRILVMMMSIRKEVLDRGIIGHTTL